MPSRATLNLNLTDQELDRIAERVSNVLKDHLNRIAPQQEAGAGRERKRLLTLRQTAEKLGLSRDAFYRLRKKGLFTEINLPIGGLRFDETEVDRVIDELKAEG